MNTDWSIPAYEAGVDAARHAAQPRARWDGQNGWDADNMETVSTRMPRDIAEQLRQYCDEAHVSRYHLINYMLRTFMAGWEVLRHDRGTPSRPESN